MAATGKAADSGLVTDALSAVNTSLGGKAAKSANLASFASGTAPSGQVPTSNGSGAVTWTTPASGVVLDSASLASIITN